MTPETLVCAENIAPERLSALRDDALPAAEAQHLHAHLATCAACQARLADYETLATALRHQGELEPGERIINGVRARLATPQAPRRPSRRPSRRLWAGLATLAPVAAIILLFVYVFSGLGGRGRPATSATPTVRATPVATNQYGKPIVPTTTPALVTLPSFTTSVSADTAWGTLTPTATFQTPNVANTAFAFNALSPDGRTLVGTALPVSATPGAGGVPRVDLISYDIASHTIRRLGPHWNSSQGPWGGAIAVSARYIAYGYNSQPGGTCGQCHATLWAYDRQTGASWEFDPGKQSGVTYTGAQGESFSGDHVAFLSMEGQVWVADLAAHQVTLALPADTQPATASTIGPDIQLLGFTWPNLIYEFIPPTQADGSQVATTLRITNLQTHTTMILTPPLNALFGAQSAAASQRIDWATRIGATLYLTTSTQLNGVDATGAPVNTSYGTLYRLSNVFTHAGAPEMVARWQDAQDSQGGALGATDRLIFLGGSYVWDLAENRLVQISSPNLNTPVQPSISGAYLMTLQAQSGGNPQTPIYQGAIYDTTTLPVR